MNQTLLAIAVIFSLAVCPVSAQEEPACSTASAQVAADVDNGSTELTRDRDLSPEEVERVVGFMVEKLLESASPSFTREEIQEATGVVVTLADAPLLQAEVFLKLEDMGIEALAGNRCADYRACSMYGDLSGASGEILAMYEIEKREDGKIFSDTELPEFTARTLNGEAVHSPDLRGHETVLAFLAVHCRHSLDSLPILDHLTEEYSARGLRVVGVYINSGSWEDVAEWLPELDPKFEVWVRNDDELGDLFSSHLVPAYFLVDSDGRITKKLVGFKEESEVLAAVKPFLGEGSVAPAGGR